MQAILSMQRSFMELEQPHCAPTVCNLPKQDTANAALVRCGLHCEKPLQKCLVPLSLLQVLGIYLGSKVKPNGRLCRAREDLETLCEDGPPSSR